MAPVGVLELLVVLAVMGSMVAAVVLAVFFAVRRSGGSQAGNPNLQPCPDCGAMISNRASTCPRCGAPVGGKPIGKG
jgi:ribosomal protein L32